MSEIILPQFPTGVPGKAVPFLAAWSTVSDGLLQGFAHALSNRVATVGALAELGRHGEPDPRATGALHQEAGRLAELLQHMRLVAGGGDDGVREEPLVLGELLGDVVALFDRHPDARTARCTLDVDAGIAPAWCNRTTLVRALLILLVAAARRTVPKRGGVSDVRVRCAGDQEAVTITIETGELPRTIDAAALWVGITSGAMRLRIVEDGDAGRCYALRVPTLLEARRSRHE